MAKEKFHFKSKEGVEIVLPRFGNLPAGLFRKVRKLEPADQMFTLLEELLSEEELAVYDELTQEDANRLAADWQSESGAPVGKSSGSSTK